MQPSGPGEEYILLFRAWDSDVMQTQNIDKRRRRRRRRTTTTTITITKRITTTTTTTLGRHIHSFCFCLRWHRSVRKGPYALHPASQQSPQGCPRNRANVCVVERRSSQISEVGMSAASFLNSSILQPISAVP